MTGFSMTAEQAKLRLIEAFYRGMGGDDHLRELLKMNVAPLYVQVRRTTITYTADWTAWAIVEHPEKVRKTEWITEYKDDRENLFSTPGYYIPRGSKRMVPRRQVKRPYTKDTVEYVVDRREKQSGTQSASQEIVQAGNFDQKMTDWLTTLPAAAEIVPDIPQETCPVIPTETIADIEQSLAQSVEKACHAAVTGNRHVDLRLTPDQQVQEQTLMIPVYRAKCSVQGVHYEAYISAMDASKYWLPTLPPTKAQQHFEQESERIRRRLDDLQKSWDEEMQRRRRACDAACAGLRKEIETIRSQAFSAAEDVEDAEFKHHCKIFGCMAAIIVLAIIFMACMTSSLPDLVRYAAMLICVAVQVPLGWFLYRNFQRSQQDYAASKSQRKRMQQDEEARIEPVRAQIDRLQAECEADLSKLRQDAESDLLAQKNSLESEREPLPPPDPEIIAALRNTAISEEERLERIWQIMEMNALRI